MPVIARPAGGIGEVVGDAALPVPHADGTANGIDLAVVAELLRLAVEDPELAAELRRRGDGRLEAYAYDRTAARLREGVAALEAAS